MFFAILAGSNSEILFEAFDQMSLIVKAAGDGDLGHGFDARQQRLPGSVHAQSAQIVIQAF